MILYILAIFLICYGIIVLLNYLSFFNLSKMIKNLDQISQIPSQNKEKISILQIADIHIGSGFLSWYFDRKSIIRLYNLVKRKNPDLIVSTGDNVMSIPIISGTINNKRATTLFIALMEKTSTPWTTCLGNHENEIFSKINREEISKMYEDKCLEYCLYNSQYGISNHILSFFDGKFKLGFLDSGRTHESDLTASKKRYGCMKEDVAAWFIENLKNSSGILFCHIPFAAFNDLNNREGVQGEPVSSPYEENKSFEILSSCPNLKAICVGHDHLNNYMGYHGHLLLSYGNTFDRLVYRMWKRIKKTYGYTWIEIDENGEFKIRKISMVW